MIMVNYEALFNESGGFFYLKARWFLHAAYRLEEVANYGDEMWIAEAKKWNLKPGKVKSVSTTKETHVAEMDKQCRSISLYLLAHSLELFIKALHLDQFKQIKYNHKISDLFNVIRDKYDFSKFDLVDK